MVAPSVMVVWPTPATVDEFLRQGAIVDELARVTVPQIAAVFIVPARMAKQTDGVRLCRAPYLRWDITGEKIAWSAGLKSLVAKSLATIYGHVSKWPEAVAVLGGNTEEALRQLQTLLKMDWENPDGDAYRTQDSFMFLRPGDLKWCVEGSR